MIKNKKLKKYGFTGFKKIKELKDNYSALPNNMGVYCVLYLGGENKPEFTDKGTGAVLTKKGKTRNPNVFIEELEKNWVANALVLYIGCTKQTLKKRIKAYLKFGEGKKYSHWGGRYIWQIKDSDNLVLCWKEINNKDPRNVEQGLIQKFAEQYKNKKPFANLQN